MARKAMQRNEPEAITNRLDGNSRLLVVIRGKTPVCAMCLRGIVLG
jgi:hypothetical protein